MGFRHISGIKEWEPFAQARYIADLVDEEGHTLQEVSDLVGRPVLEVKAMYRDHEIVRQAKVSSSILTRLSHQHFASSTPPCRSGICGVSIDAPSAGHCEHYPMAVASGNGRRAGETLVYMYGDARGRGRVLPESRMLKDLGRVLADEPVELRPFCEKPRVFLKP